VDVHHDQRSGKPQTTPLIGTRRHDTSIWHRREARLC
jgi:hypothetical protein